ncbi:hypothetical protein AXG93_673s1150 [Marchantia polymorpha subsp. ruderalis]|uniref:Uncharacterized protein n=1 Tax=Marchantia polymorpha subsp. ruderalis TaxID=1480154 RepID=A0A176WIA9_MARPO|nr:hypothetical protein AXG93_673s1150 [Marchantia polymorpha subsp. ruderalis]
MLVCSFVSYLASRCAFSDRLPLGQYQAECCLKVENLSAKPVSEWSLQDWEELTNATKCCDMSDRYRLSACSAVASARENPQIEPKAVEPSDCCMLLDALMRRPHAEWTFRERLHYRKWNECCAEHMVYEQSIHKHVKEGSGDDCCKSFEALNCTSAEDLSAEERGRLNAAPQNRLMWTMKDSLDPKHGETSVDLDMDALVDTSIAALERSEMKSMTPAMRGGFVPRAADLLKLCGTT